MKQHHIQANGYNERAYRFMRGYIYILLSLFMLALTAGCSNAIDRLEWVGKEPPMQEIQDPQQKVPPVRWPVAKSEAARVTTTNSLWSPSSKSFFRDGRAYKVGDILKVKIEIQDKAELDNKTERKRNNSEALAAPQIFGLQDLLSRALPENQDPTNLLSITGTADNSGEGAIEREEVIETEIAAVVIQVLPNDSLVIYGSQEIRVNYEVRQLTVQGVIRPIDIAPDNSIASNQIAEARISYGGRGLISDVQQPRVGTQVLDIVSPW